MAINYRAESDDAIMFAGVDCIANGDLCNDHEVRFFPHLTMYKDGEKIEDFPPKAELLYQDLATFVDKHLPMTFRSTKPKKPKKQQQHSENVNPQGVSFSHTLETFTQQITLKSDPSDSGWFIMFHLPSCHHCQAMRPAWEALAPHMKNQLNIGEVNCQTESRLCRDIKVHAFPTLMFFKGSERLEYKGLRGLGDLVKFAEKGASAGVHSVDAAEFEAMEKRDDVIFLYFYDKATTSEDLGALQRTALPIMSHAPLLKTNDVALIRRFKITSFPKLIVVRDAKPSFYQALMPADMRDHRRLLDWMREVWLPILPELTAANSEEIMKDRTVVLAILDPTEARFEAMKNELKVKAMEWLDYRAAESKAEKQELRDKKAEKIEAAKAKGDARALDRAKQITINVPDKRDVKFAWVDGVFWGKWLRSTYGIDVRETGTRIIINEQYVRIRLCFFDGANIIDCSTNITGR